MSRRKSLNQFKLKYGLLASLMLFMSDVAGQLFRPNFTDNL